MKRTLLTWSLLALLTISASSEPYHLDWQHLNVAPHYQEQKPVAEPPKPVRPFFAPSFVDVTPSYGYRDRWLRPNIQESYDIELQAMAYFNDEQEAYHFVEAVEMTTVIDGRQSTEVFTNNAQNRSLRYSLPRMQEGDSFRVKVFWSDGSHRIQEGIVNVYADRWLVFDEPDFMTTPGRW